MSDKEYTIADMINTARGESPSEFQNAFNAVMMDKVQAAVELQKSLVAQKFFNHEQQDQESEQSDETSEDGESEQLTQEDETDEDTEPNSENEG